MIDPLTAGYIAIGCFLIFLFLALPIGISMGLAGMVGIFLATGFSGLFKNIGTIGFEHVFSISLLAIPLFVFMGSIVSIHGLGADLFDTTYKWINKVPGGLCITSLFMGALFGFMCGSATAGAITIGSVALPEMISKGYDKKLATGSLAFGGTLSSIIPPSALMIIYASQVEASLGRLFFAGIIPGFLLTFLAMVYVFAHVIMNPKIAPRGVEVFSLREKLLSLRGTIPLIVLFLTVLGTMYAGICSPVEAGAGGCIVAYLLSAVYGRCTKNRLSTAILHSVSSSVMIFILIIGAGILSQMFFISGLRQLLTRVIIGWELPPWGVIVVFLAVLTVMGMFMDVIGMLLISLPIMYPVIIQLGYDPIWFGVIMILACELALITPPVGVNLFVIQSIAPKGTTVPDVAKGALGFCFVIWLTFVILIAFPQIALWLPSTMMRR